MGARGSCSVCFDPRRPQIDAARAEGAPVATIARNFNVPTTTLGRHFAHARPKARPAPVAAPVSAPAPAPARYVGAPTRGSVPLARVEEAAALLGVPAAELAWCISEHASFDILTPTDAEEERLYDLFDEAEESPDYAEAVRVSVAGLVRIVA